MKIILAEPRGFCAGVQRAIEMVERALEKYGSPVYVKHEIVHNKHVVERLEKMGAIFVEEISQMPEGALCIFSAHGVSQQVRTDAKERNLRVFDASCPLVLKVHTEVAHHAKAATNVILIGHKGHVEVTGTMGQYLHSTGSMYLVGTKEEAATIQVQDPENLAYVTQTTLSVDETKDIINVLKARFPYIRGPKKDDICYATQNRQDAVRVLAEQCDLVLVVGSKNSSNSRRLQELAQVRGVPSFLIDFPEDIPEGALQNVKCVGITAGASAPESVVQDLIQYLQKNHNAHTPELLTVREENMHFNLPPELKIETVHA